MRKNRWIQAVLALSAAGLLLNGCGTAVKRCAEPELNLPDAVVAGLPADSLCMADLDWWEIYGSDPVLLDLIHRTLENNKDLLTAAARVRELERMHRVSVAGRLPSLDARVYANVETNDYAGSSLSVDPEMGPKLSLAWEADLFGKLRWASRADLAAYLGSVENRRALQMTLVAETATAYYELVALDNELEIVQRTLVTRQESERQARLRFEGGMTNETTYQQAKVELATTASLVPELERKIKVKENEIALLTGSYPGRVDRSVVSLQERMPEMLQTGIPSDLLRRRPDLRASEQALRTAMAKVGVAWADRFPNLTIRLTGGLENNALLGLLSSPFSYAIADLTSPVFAFGKKKAQYEASLEAYEQARYQYEKKVLQAFREVNDAVVSYASAQETVRLMDSLKSAARKYVDLARFQHINGTINYIDVLDAQRKYFQAEISLSNAVRDEYLALISLYKALGGGWSVPASGSEDRN